MDTNKKTTATNPPVFSKTNVSQSFGDMAEKGNAQAKDAYEKTSAASIEAADIFKNCCFTAVRGAQDYNNKFMEFAHANSNSAFEFIQKLYDVKSPSAFIELSTEHSRKTFETLTEQSKQLAALVQNATSATAEPVKAVTTKAFNHSS
jgi:phasin